MGCVKLHILDEQYKSTELRVSYFNKELTLNNSAVKAYRYLFTGYERDQESGLDYAHARYYYSTFPYFISTDPKWEDYPESSSYAYCGNNPVNRVDEDGEFWANIIGAVISGGIDYAGQVAGNLATGKKLGDALTDVSVGSIIVSAVEGAINPIGGISKAALKTAAKTTAKTVVKSVAKTTVKEAATSAAGQVLDNAIKGKSLTDNVVTEAVVGGVLGNAKIAPNSPKANQTIKELNIKQNKGKTLTNRQTERMATAKTEKVGNDAINVITTYSATSTQKAVTNETKNYKEKNAQ